MSSYLGQHRFWTGAGERAVRAAAAVLLVRLGGGPLGEQVGVDVRAVDWPTAASMAAGVAIVSLLLSVAAGKVSGPPGSASFVFDRPRPDQPTRLPAGDAGRHRDEW